MSYINCLRCDRELNENSIICKCGWKKEIKNIAVSENMIKCSFFDCYNHGWKNVSRINEKEFLCKLHWEEFILKNQNDEYFKIDAQQIFLTRHFDREAKNLLISNYEYFKKNCNGWMGMKEKLIGF